MNLLFVDFETFYDTKAKYDLKSLSMCEYIRDKRFKVFGMGYTNTLDGVYGWKTSGFENWALMIDWSDTTLVSHNVKFDGAILKWHYDISPALYMDTVALARAVLGNTINNYSLKRLAEYLGLEAKGELKTDGLATLSLQQEKELAEYCLRDVRICKAIYERLSPSFPGSQSKSLDWTIRAFIEPKLVLDTEVLNKAVIDEKARREEAIKATGYTKEQLASSKQFAELVSRAGGTVPEKISKRTGRSIPSFAKTDEGLKSLEAILPTLVRGRLAAKSTILETRATKLAGIGASGSLWPFDVQFSGAVQTHRYSGGSGAGGNPQNFPRVGPLRASVQSAPGTSLVVGDFAQIEARIIAWLANEPKLMAAFSEGRDVYSEFGSVIYGRPITKEDEVERRFAKEAVLGLGYGMGFTKFKARVKAATGMEITDEEARRVVSLYRETYFNVPKLWERAESLLPSMSDGGRNRVPFALFLSIEKNALVLPSGLKLSYPNIRVVGREFNKPQWGYDKYLKRYDAEVVKIYGGKLIENICQALAGEICKIAIERATTMGIECVGQVHDEILSVCEEAQTGHCAGVLKGCMEAPISWMPTLKLKAEVSYGKNWQEAKN